MSMDAAYVIWSNEHKCWWAPNRCGYRSSLDDAGRYSRDEAIKICVHARGGRQFNANPSEVPILYADAVLFWTDDKPEWRRVRAESDDDSDYHEPDESGYSRADEEWFFGADGRP